MFIDGGVINISSIPYGRKEGRKNYHRNLLSIVGVK